MIKVRELKTLYRMTIALAAALLVLLVNFHGTEEAAAGSRLLNLSKSGQVGRISVVLGHSQTFRLEQEFSTMVVADPDTADVNGLTNRTLYVQGRKLGTTNITLFDENKKLVAVIDVEVTHNLDGMRQALKQSLPYADIKVRSLDGRVMLEGHVSNSPAADKAMAIAKEFAGDDVTNSLNIEANQQVNLEVRFVEVSRLAGKELGINWNVLGSGLGVATGNAVGNAGAGFTVGVGSLSAALPFGTLLASVLSGGTNADVLISALEQKQLARRLAEPNLTAISGQKASFLAGGEFPIPIAQDNNKVTVEFKSFGVKLDFTPTVLDNGLIDLHIQPEVSEIDAANSVRLTTGSIAIPGLSVRRADTSVELRNGQSFAIAGLLQTVNAKTIDQLPWLGNVPVLGALFRSSSFQKRESDLVIIVTPRLAVPVGNRQQLADPLQNPVASNEPEFFLMGQEEVSKKALDVRYKGQYGHIIDLPKVK